MHPDALHPNQAVAARLEALYALHRTDIDFRLGRSPYSELLMRLGNPHLHLPPTIHVAGTNGKGSTIAFMRAMAEAAGLRVHVYTSPHLTRFNERIVLGSAEITDAPLISLIDRVHEANQGQAVTFFEFTTALAFLAFAETPADLLLLEVGMGGRLDCTNIIPPPLVSVITKISFDHMDFLGATLPAIAAEKAGIIKSGSPAVVGPQMSPDLVMPVFEAAARAVGAPLTQVTTPAMQPDGTFTFAGHAYPAPALVGAHQYENAATALTAMQLAATRANLKIPPAALSEGLKRAAWRGRLEPITSGPLAARLPTGSSLWFDAAHNDSGALALAAQLRHWRAEAPEQPVYLLVGLGADKDAGAFFGALEGLYDRLVCLDLPSARKPRMATDLLALWHQTRPQSGATPLQAPPVTAPTIAAALEALPLKGGEGGTPATARVVIAGSLYLYTGLGVPL